MRRQRDKERRPPPGPAASRPSRRLLPLACALFALWAAACAGPSKFKQVEFKAPSSPDPALRPFLKDVGRMGVLCVTNIEPFRELDTEKVLARLSNAITRNLSNLPETKIVTQDEITWQLRDQVTFDSTSVFSDSTQQLLHEAMELDALIYVELRNLQARMTPMTPTPYGLAPNPGMDLMIDLRVSLINLRSGRIWQQSGQQRNWQPIHLQLIGGNDQTERQLLMALGGPLQRFLERVAPPPRTQIRRFELSGN